MALSKQKIIEVQKGLRACGWPIPADGDLGPRTREAVHDFQRGLLSVKTKLGWQRRRLRVTGRPGWRTRRALERAVAQNGACSQHFRFAEFKSHGNGWIKLNRQLVNGLEAYRQLVRHGITIVSGYRDPAYNASIGGATQSQHMSGNAADIAPEVSTARVRALRKFNGIGFQGTSGLVRHVDVGHTWGTVSAPITWVY